MPFLDYPLTELQAYRPDVREPADFDEFWAATLAEHSVKDPSSAISMTPSRSTLHVIDAWDVTFPGFGSQVIHARYTRPAAVTEQLPIVVEFVGYGGGRGLVEEHLTWAASGLAHLIVDTRGQGTRWSGGGDTGDTADTDASGGGFMTRGIRSPHTYYYRRVFTDAAHALQIARLLPGVDPTRVIPTGGSQGGAITLAASALDGNVVGFMANVPFLCNFERAIGLTGAYPYQEIVDYLSVKRDDIDLVFNTLSYFDCVNFAKRIVAPGLFSVGLMDETTPPSTGFAARNWCRGETAMEVYPFNGHEGGGPYQVRRQIKWVRDLLGYSA